MEIRDAPTDLDDPVQTIRLRLDAAGVDTGTIVIEVRDATVFLNGTIADPDTRASIVAVLFVIPGVDKVVDSLRLGNEEGAPQIYMKRGASLERAIGKLFDPGSTWEDYRATKNRVRPI